MSVLVAAVAAALFGLGTYLLLQRKLSRIIIGVGLLSHGANLVLVSAGRRGLAPFIGSAASSRLADPLPHALVLTAIVISFGVTAFLLALAYRSWLLTDDDDVPDDVDDRAIGRTSQDDDLELADATTVRPENLDAPIGDDPPPPEGDAPVPPARREPR